MNEYIIYTDGGCIKNPGGKGGIGVVILSSSGKMIKTISNGYLSTTNNRMELRAAIEGLRSIPKDSKVLLYSDSQYLIRTMNGEYQKGKNLDLWQQLDKVRKGKLITWKWVRGHNGNKYNETCDYLAETAYLKDDLEEDVGYKNKTKKRLF